MPTRAAADRPSRRLDAVLSSLRRHGVTSFEGTLPGIGQVKMTLRKVIDVEVAAPPRQLNAPAVSDTAHRVSAEPPAPVDELELVVSERPPLDANGVQ